MLSARAAGGKPIRVGLIGAGRFGSMALAQVRALPGIQVAAVADLNPGQAHTALALALWPPQRAVARSLGDAIETGATWVTTDAAALFSDGALDVVIEASGDPAAALRHAAAAIAAGTSVIMATLAADVLAGPLLAARAEEKGVIYSLASGDQPAQVCALVDEARAAGLEVVAAGMGTRFLPAWRAITPDTVWPYAGMDADRARAEGLNPRTVTAALDGTKAALSMAAVANATGLSVPAEGLAFPPCGAQDLATLLKPRSEGGLLESRGQVEAVSSLERDGRMVMGGLPHGVWATVRPPSPYAGSCWPGTGLATDPSGNYAALWQSHHLGGLGLGGAIASVGLRREAVGCPRVFAADVVAMAKRDLSAGEILDGVGGATVWGRLMPSSQSMDRAALPIGLADGVRLTRPVAANAPVSWDDVELDAEAEAVILRRAMEDKISFE